MHILTLERVGKKLNMSDDEMENVDDEILSQDDDMAEDEEVLSDDDEDIKVTCPTWWSKLIHFRAIMIKTICFPMTSHQKL